MTRDEYVASLKQAFVTLGTKVSNGYLVAQIPFLGNPIVNKFLTLILNKLMKELVDNVETGAFFTYIDVRVPKQGRDFASAAWRNYQAQQSGTPEEKSNAEKDLIKKFHALAMLTN